MIEAILTIDDFPSANTPALVDYLCENQIPAVFFAVGGNIEKFYDNAIYALKKGFVVGNHSYSHPSFSSITLEEGIAEIEKTEALLDKLYEDAGVERTYKVFRFPYGDKGGENKDALQETLKNKGFVKLGDKQIPYAWYEENGLHADVDTFWTYDFAEWMLGCGQAKGADEIIARMEDKNPGSGEPLFLEDARHILLFHDHVESEAVVSKYYKIFLDYAKSGGVCFVKAEFYAL